MEIAFIINSFGLPFLIKVDCPPYGSVVKANLPCFPSWYSVTLGVSLENTQLVIANYVNNIKYWLKRDSTNIHCKI